MKIEIKRPFHGTACDVQGRTTDGRITKQQYKRFSESCGGGCQCPIHVYLDGKPAAMYPDIDGNYKIEEL